jgi:hypothetical protein
MTRNILEQALDKVIEADLMKEQKYKLYVQGKFITSFESAQEAMDYGRANYPEGYTVK